MLAQKANRAALLSPRGRRCWEVELIRGGARVIVHRAELDAVDAQKLGEYLLALAEEVGGWRLQVDLGQVRSLNAFFLGKLIALNRRLRATGGHLTLLDVTPEVYEIFELTHLTDVLDLSEGS